MYCYYDFKLLINSRVKLNENILIIFRLPVQFVTASNYILMRRGFTINIYNHISHLCTMCKYILRYNLKYFKYIIFQKQHFSAEAY